MKVILLEDVKALGKKGDIVNVSDGYARNAILPKKLGVEATSKNLNDLKLQNQHADKGGNGGDQHVQRELTFQHLPSADGQGLAEP